MALPANINYGTVSGVFLRAKADGVDVDRNPDGDPIRGLKVTFTPSISPALVKNTTAVPPVTILIDPVVCTTDDDGVLCGPDGSPDVLLVASGDTDLDPSGWTWTVEIKQTSTFPRVSFAFVVGVDSVTDLSTVVPVPAGLGAEIAAWEAAIADTLANKVAAQAAATDAQAAQAAAEAVPTTTDGLMTTIDANAASAYRVQADARQNATIDGKVAPAQLALATPGQLASVLRRGREDAVLAVLGDSTGNETTEWFYMLIQWLGTMFPAYTITHRIWDDATQAYLAATTVQTGTGARTLTVYNGSHPGAASNYPFENSSYTRFLKMLPVAPTAVITSFGYNSALAYYRDSAIEVSRWVRGYYPQAEYIVVAQPPKGDADGDQANSLKRSADVRAVALANGFGLIDAALAFLDYGDFTADLISVDGIHPNAAGSAVWRDVAKRYFDPEFPAVMPRTATPSLDRLWVPARDFVSTLGVPTIGGTPANVPAWIFGPDSLEIVAATVDIPPSWGAVNVTLIWSTSGGTTTNVHCSVDWMKLTDGVAVPLSGFTPAGFTNGALQTVASQAVSASRALKVYTREPFAGGRPLVFRVRRLGNDAADTYGGSFYVYGLMIERAE